MIVCICNAINSEKIKDACLKAFTFGQMLEMIEYKQSCGACYEELERIWEEINGDQKEADFEEDWHLPGEL
jgi:bacterioferritin-associated ferredoxin